jgi:hypothetical protein
MNARLVCAICAGLLVSSCFFGCRSVELSSYEKEARDAERIARKWLRDRHLRDYAEYHVTIERLDEDRWVVGIKMEKFEFGLFVSLKEGKVVHVNPSG